jgi:DMSO/TMAO reductase YedYZ molybdopterin-dependent catalytic subunit
MEAMERRKFIIAAVAGGIGLFEYKTVSQWMNGMSDPLPISVKAYEKYGAHAALAAITPNGNFYVTSKGGTPRIDRDKWRLTFDGLIAHPFTLNYADLVALPKIEKDFTLECISNTIGGSAIGNAKWTGTPLKPLLERAAPLKDAAHAILYGADGLSTGHPIARLWNEENFFAYQMNGEDLPPIHGYPVRIFIPGKFGMKQPKWITRIELVNKAYLGYWESQGWSDNCERWAQARFTDIRDGARISGKNFEFTGYAVGNLDGIKSVEISFDDGKSWQPTTIFSNPSPITWAFWKYIWVSPRSGKYRIRVRAIDGKGRIEGPGPTNTFPNGATGQEEIEVTVA